MAKIKEQIDYGNTPERMDPNLERKLASPDSLYAQNPAMRKGAADVQRLVSQRFQKVADKLIQVTGIQDLSSKQVQGMVYNEMMERLRPIMQIEAANKEALEQSPPLLPPDLAYPSTNATIQGRSSADD